jgi:hypothetical protein
MAGHRPRERSLRRPESDALALLRAHAYATETSLDDLAAQVITRQFLMEDLSLEPDPSR